MSVADIVANAVELEPWLDVPRQVVTLYKEASPVTSRIQRLAKTMKSPRGYGQVFWHPKNKHAWVVLDDAADQATHNRWTTVIGSVNGVRSVKTVAESRPPEGDDWVMLKTAAAPLGFIGNNFTNLQKPFGGPSPLTSSILGGLLTGAAGYGVGTLFEHLLPERYVRRGRLRKTLGLGGMFLGALPGIWKGTTAARNSAAVGQPLGMRAAITPDDSVPINPAATGWTKESRFAGALSQLPACHELAVKAAAEFSSQLPANWDGGLYADSIPVDAFNNAVWNDVRKDRQAATLNPYGTRSPWGTNEQGMHTPPAVGAATTGIIAGIGAQSGANIISPMDVIRGLVSAGVGLATANVAGRTLGALAGLTPAAQEKVQDMGLWAGLLTSVIPPLFR